MTHETGHMTALRSPDRGGSRRLLQSNEGFSLVELLIVMVLFVVVLAASSNTFTLILKQSTQQVKQSETQMERIVGLEMLRTDIGSAGFGLPWSFRNTISYNEAASASVCGGNGSSGVDPSGYNDAPGGIPRAIFFDTGVCMNGSDYLVVKSTSVSTSSSSQDWSYISNGSTTPRTWGSSDISNGDNVIVIEPQQSSNNIRQLVMNGAAFSTAYSSNAFDSNFTPFNPGEVFLIYDVDPNYNLRMPFNRADYFISTSNVPSSCAPNTGVLVKATVSHQDGTMTNQLPLLDCVADMKVIYVLNSPSFPSYTTVTTGLTADQIRNEVVEIRLYILSHEGKMDAAYTYPGSTVNVGEFGLGDSPFTLSAHNITNWQNYRWKVSTIAVVPRNLQ